MFWPLAQTPVRWPPESLAGQAAEASVELSAGSPWPIVVGLCGIAAIVAVWGLASRFAVCRKPPTIGRPWRLFLQVARAHRLAWRDVWLLYRVACRLKLEQPALLFVQPENFAPDRFEGLRADRVARLAQLRQRLFEGLEARLATDADAPSPPQAPDPAPSLPDDPSMAATTRPPAHP